MTALKKSTGILVKVALFACILATWQDGFFSPCLTAIYEAFPTDSTFLQTFVLTGPSLVAIPFILASGFLANKTGKKSLLVIGIVLYLIGNVGCAFVNSMEMMAVARAVGGIGANVAFTMLFAIMPEVIPDEEENARVMGIWNVISSIVGAVVSLVAGVVCLSGWRSTMMLNLVAVLALITAVLFLPSDSSAVGVPIADEVSDEAETQPAGIMGIVWFFEFAALVSAIFGMINFYYPDLYVAEHALGTSALSGAMGSGYVIGGAITSLVFAALYERIKKHILYLLYGITALGYLILMVPGIPPAGAIAAMVIGGAGMGISNCFFGFIIGRTAPADKVSMMVSVWSTLNFLGIFICSYVPYVLQSIFRVELLTDTYLYVGIILLVVAAVLGTINFRYMRNNSKRSE